MNYFLAYAKKLCLTMLRLLVFNELAHLFFKIQIVQMTRKKTGNGKVIL
jgi:hypothetical protein